MFSGIVLAGGSSKRMKSDKRLTELEGETLLERSANKLKELTSDVVVVTAGKNETCPDIDKVKFTYDHEPGKGPLMGIYSGLLSCSYKQAVVLPVDTPFVTVSFLKYLIEKSSGFDFTVPIWSGGIEPLVAVYSKELISILGNWLESGDKPAPHLLTNRLEKGRIKYIKENEVRKFGAPEILFHNINTIEDINFARKYLETHDERY